MQWKFREGSVLGGQNSPGYLSSSHSSLTTLSPVRFMVTVKTEENHK